MKKLTVLILLINIVQYSIFAQDTVYSDAYPNGIVVKDFKLSKWYKKIDNFPIENDKMYINIPNQEIVKINYSIGMEYINPKYKPTGYTVLSTNLLTGKIFYSEVIELKGLKKKEIFEALKRLPNTEIEYELISSDETEASSIYYRCFSHFKFAGDLQTLYWGLTIKIKDGKVKYEYSDFRFFFKEQKGSSIRGGRNYTMDATHIKDKTLESLYIYRYRGERFLTKISKDINGSIESIKLLSKNATKNEW